jgi:hypothetical protein
MTFYTAGSVVNARRASSVRITLVKQKISNKRDGGPLGQDIAGAVAAENLASVPAWVAKTASQATDQALSEDSDADRHTAIADAVRRVTELYITAVLEGLRSGVPPQQTPLAAVLFDVVCDAVHEKVSLYYLLRALKIAYLETIEYYSAAVENAVDRRPPSIRSDRTRDHASAYADSLSARIAHVYVTEVDKRMGDLSVVQEGLVDDILAGHPVDHADAERILGLDLAHHHLAVVLWACPGTAVSSEQLGQFAIELARALGSPRPLIVSSGPARAWIWISWLRPPADELVARACEILTPPPGVRASMGPVAAGVTGFQRSHLGAQAAARVAATGEWGNSWFFNYADLAVVSLATSDPQQARWFVEETLGALGQPGLRRAELRETLRVYLAFGRSRLRAAERLHVARNTVAYRVDKAVSLLGRKIDGDELQVRLALEIARVLPSE